MARQNRLAASNVSQFLVKREISAHELRALRMQAQCLMPRQPKHAIIETVRMVCGVNAQLPSAMALSLRARIEGLTFEDLEACRIRDRALVRTWCMRGTMHLLAAEDVDWLLSALAPTTLRSGWRWLEKRAGLDRAQAEKVLEDAHRILRQRGPLTRPELMAALTVEHGTKITSAAAGVVWLNGMLGRIAFGPEHGSKPTYVALDNWLGRAVRIAPEPDYLELSRRYLRGYGPAEPSDMAAWWGLALSEAQSAWASLSHELEELNVDGRPMWALQESNASVTGHTAEPNVRLIPAFDTYLLGYKARDIAVNPAHRGHIFHGGEVAPVVLIEGMAAGIWRYEFKGKQMSIRVSPFAHLDSALRDSIALEADDIGRFFSKTVNLSLNDDLLSSAATPKTKRQL